MRIAFLNTLYPPHGPIGGAETTLRFLAQSLAGRGHSCAVITLTPERRQSQAELDGIPVHYLPLANVYWPHGGDRPRALRPIFQAIEAYNPIMARRLGRVLDEVRPDVINAHNLQGFSVSAWVAARRLGIPIVQTVHDYYLACPRSTMWRPGKPNCAIPCAECRLFAMPRRLLSHLPQSVTCVSHRVLNRLAAAGVFRGAQARIIRGNNLEPGPFIPTRRGRDGPLRLGFIGRLDPSKGLETLLDALMGFDPGLVQLSVAGSGAPVYEAALRSRGAPRNDVTFLGHVAPVSFFPAIDLLVIPSAWEEPFARVFHEALSYGVPSLILPQGGLPEAVDHGRTGLVAPTPDADGLRAIIGRLLDTRWDPTAMRQACLKAAELYSADRIVGQYEAVLEAAAAGREPPPWAGEMWRSTEESLPTPSDLSAEEWRCADLES
ncbi:MAG: glycosyltransferase family 4 protein [Acetobacteraceae bacterium]|nr:glycosyltransferase family 4 protein [Acetobacteraceae bacterium]